MALFEHYVLVCVNRRPDDAPKGSCAARGSEAIYEKLKTLLRERGLTQLRVRAMTCGCLGCCLDGPTILVEPDHFSYGRVTLADVPDVVDALERGDRVERLVLASGPAGRTPVDDFPR
jgi:(2Fe-2S) ferredoxin